MPEKERNSIEKLGDKWNVFKHDISNKVFSSYWRRKVKNRNFSIISNNCIGGWIYQKLGLQYTTPTIGAFFFSDDYIRFLENLEYYLRQPLKLKKTSRHPEANEVLKLRHSYNIGVLGDDVEIQFVHYKDEEDIINKWKRRVARINFENLFIIFSDRDNFMEEFFLRYQQLPFEHKIFLSSKPRNSDSAIFMRDYEGQLQVGKSYNREYEKYFDVIKWLNGEKDFLKTKRALSTARRKRSGVSHV